MARTPPSQARSREEPSIIIDPSLYVPERRCLLQLVCDTFLDVTRAVLVLALASVTVFSVVHVVRCRSLSARPAAPPFVLQLAAPSEMQLAAMGSLGPGLLEQDLAQAVAERDAVLRQVGAPTLGGAPKPPHARVRMASPPQLPSSRRALDVVLDVRTGQRMLALQRMDEAERAFLDALALRTGQPAALSGLARVYLARGDVDDALALAERAVASAPFQASYHLTLADVLRVSGEISAADAQYEFAARLSPKALAQTRGPLPPNPF